MSETLPDLKKESAAQSADIVLGFNNAAGFAMLQRAAGLLASSTLVPEAYRKWIKDKNNKYGPLVENEAAISNCVIALNMAQRLEADPIMIMQNLYVVEGRPSWSSQFIIAALNTTGRFSPLRFQISEPETKTVHVTTVEWIDKKKHVNNEDIEIQDRTCIAWAIEKETGERLESPPVSIEMAALEGWLTKKGSKWKTMPDLMLRYRAATLFGRLYAPEKLMGLQTEDESRDVYDLEPIDNGTYAAKPALTSTADLNAKVFDQEPVQPSAAEQPAPANTKASNKPTKAEMDQRRAEAKAAVQEAGLSLDLVEKELNAFQPAWTTAQCERAHKLAERAMAQREAQAQAQPAGADDTPETVECPNSGNTVRLAVECAACDQMGQCPMTDGQA